MFAAALAAPGLALAQAPRRYSVVVGKGDEKKKAK
jgi:hypothetical protein